MTLASLVLSAQIHHASASDIQAPHDFTSANWTNPQGSLLLVATMATYESRATASAAYYELNGYRALIQEEGEDEVDVVFSEVRRATRRHQYTIDADDAFGGPYYSNGHSGYFLIAYKGERLYWLFIIITGEEMTPERINPTVIRDWEYDVIHKATVDIVPAGFH